MNNPFIGLESLEKELLEQAKEDGGFVIMPKSVFERFQNNFRETVSQEERNALNAVKGNCVQHIEFITE